MVPAIDWGDYAEEEEREGFVEALQREVYYVCMKCGRLVKKSEVDRFHAFMCPHCGYRILMKVRAPPATGRIRRVYAI